MEDPGFAGGAYVATPLVAMYAPPVKGQGGTRGREHAFLNRVARFPRCPVSAATFASCAMIAVAPKAS
jgi:hypothetical protein